MYCYTLSKICKSYIESQKTSQTIGKVSKNIDTTIKNYRETRSTAGKIYHYITEEHNTPNSRYKKYIPNIMLKGVSLARP
jgi:hypothetical protein